VFEYGNDTITANIRVLTADEYQNDILSISVNPSGPVQINQGDSITVGGTLDLRGGDSLDVYGSALDYTITQGANLISLDPETGNVTGTVPGTAKVKVSITNSEGTVFESGELTITVVTVPVTSVSLDKTSDSVIVGDTTALAATVSPDNASDKTVTWSSSDPSVATVDQNGVVTGVSTGTAVITATTEDGSFTASYTVTVFGLYYAALGDSVPAGYGLADPSAQCYPADFSGLLTDNGIPNHLTNMAVSGITSTALLPRRSHPVSPARPP